MKQTDFFKNAIWVGSEDRTSDTFSVLRGNFYVDNVECATLNVLGLGFFKCYINGILINPDTFLPLSSDYEGSNDPVDEVISGHRIYVPQFDITPYVKNGENVIAVHYGGGWYCFKNRVFGLPKAIYCVSVKDNRGETDFVSDKNCKIGKSFVTRYDITRGECRDYTEWTDCFDLAFDDSSWSNAVATEGLDTEYCTTDCPIDALIETIIPVKMGEGENGTVYDCGVNTTGYPVIKINAPKGERVKIRFSEELLPDGKIDMAHNQGQECEFISDGKGRVVQPDFTWYGFRCFEVEGDAEALEVKVIHSDVKINSTFNCSNETLNWTYKTFIHTMLCNMHTGHPSDCPHLERRGYTGDGQLTTNAVFTTMNAENLYTKWLQDIADCQDVKSGHIQYTAPYIRSGGGPGGWGSAIVEVPYQSYKHFGNTELLAKYYPNMRRYIDYLEAHTEYGLVTSDKAGEWCLGDWCCPNILYPEKDITSHNQQVALPAAMVNTYFMVKSLEKMSHIARLIGKAEDIPEYKEKITYRKNAVRAAYFNAFDNNFVMNIHGANAFGVDIGLGNENTYKNLVTYYEKVGCFDTGIFATDILIRLLFENGDEDLAIKLLTNNGEQGYEHWRVNGATTFHEYWDSNRSRSHSHPMFGAPVAYFFQYLLGITQAKTDGGYKRIVIEPKGFKNFEFMQGSMATPNGDVAVSYENKDGRTHFEITIPEGVNAVFKHNEVTAELKSGTSVIIV